MILKSEFFRHKDSILHYYKYGSGVKTLICFHGFGQDAHFFKSLAERLSSLYTVYAFDLFHHGKSECRDCDTAISPKKLSAIIDAWLSAQKIDSISLCGYSMGGKIVMSLVEHSEVRIEKLLLIAPDGIETNFWYNMATYPYWARVLFKYTITHPGIFLQAVSFFGKVKILDKGIIRFAKFQMNSVSKRKKVYCTWLTYRKIKPDVKKVAQKLNIFEIPMKVYLGKYDRIITEKSISPLIRQVKSYELFILDKGHNTLIEDVAREKNFNF
ncbi:alpha/beta hydrolase [Catalinimonas niigatensis]|uniref:alpha/beta hydrolase n=1 Tax=Catalinimonas niigatensis TaxID=1397264 RepID=UPI002665270A|nr:alpha/beta hydrolase [Catalinimonas niigatensis]WPP49906.1 alpha/beta hydrolase [Catalinimonas niigatensis]